MKSCYFQFTWVFLNEAEDGPCPPGWGKANCGRNGEHGSEEFGEFFVMYDGLVVAKVCLLEGEEDVFPFSFLKPAMNSLVVILIDTGSCAAVGWLPSALTNSCTSGMLSRWVVSKQPSRVSMLSFVTSKGGVCCAMSPK